MPKYIPDADDLYKQNACFICGSDFVPVHDDEGCCSDSCREQQRIFIEDYEAGLMKLIRH